MKYVSCGIPYGIGIYNYVGDNGKIETGYGFYRPENPHDFTPDYESCTEKEISAWKQDCDAWDKAYNYIKIINAPEELRITSKSVFLAGSIEMGKAVDWQTQVTNALEDMDVTILNPRRDDWNSSWEQKITNPQFNEQVTWELTALDKASVIAMYFDPKTMSPISLLELGLYADQGKMIVCCPEGFWRKGNVDIVCKKYRIPQVDNIDDLIYHVRARLEKK